MEKAPKAAKNQPWKRSLTDQYSMPERVKGQIQFKECLPPFGQKPFIFVCPV
jgi:hypothetical protein